MLKEIPAPKEEVVQPLEAVIKPVAGLLKPLTFEELEQKTKDDLANNK